jgi:hypothetical protein
MGTQLWRLKDETAERIQQYGRFGETRDQILQRILNAIAEPQQTETKQTKFRDILNQMLMLGKPIKQYDLGSFVATVDSIFEKQKTRPSYEDLATIWQRNTQQEFANEAEFTMMLSELLPYLPKGTKIEVEVSGKTFVISQ